MSPASPRPDDIHPAVLPRSYYRGSGQPGAPVERHPGAADRLPPDPTRSSWRSRRTSLVWVLAWETLRRMPEWAAFGLAHIGGLVAYRCAPAMRQRVRTNLARVVPPEEDGRKLDEAVQSAFRSYARYWVEAFRAADISVEDMHARTTTAGFPHLDGALADGRGVIVLLAHHGSWDMAARWAESHGYHLAVVAEVLRPRQLFERFVRLREDIGLEVVPLPRRGDLADARRGSIAARLGEVLDANHLVGLLTDRDLSGRAPATPFFDAPTRIPLGAAALAARKGAPIVPITMLQQPLRRWHLQILPAIHPRGRSVRAIHNDVVRALEDLIRLDPSQWHAFQPMWPAADRATPAENAPPPAVGAPAAAADPAER